VGIDARTLPEDESALAKVLEDAVVVGRVTPEQKRAIVRALQSQGHTVAMTGDGVNDALALKDADLGVAMGSGAPATKAVARLVLLDGRFSSMPAVVAQGRRVMANMERVSTLFVSKTAYSVLISLVVVLWGLTYPFLPRHMTIVDALTIGIPAFVLAIPPNPRRYIPGFLRRVLARSVPAGLIIALCVLIGTAIAVPAHSPHEQGIATLVALGVPLAVLINVAKPFSTWKAALVAAMAGAMILAIAIGPVRDFFALVVPSMHELAVVLTVIALGWVAVFGVFALVKRVESRFGALIEG
jgi:cation-transporting ATPase E